MFEKLSQLWRRLLFYLWRDRFDRELEEEMRFHLEMKAEENLAAGVSPEEARYAAQRQFGNQTLLQEVSRDMWGVRSIETLFQDLRYGVRILLKQPGFTLIAALSLALGIGANTAIFSLLDAVLLKPLPVQEPEKLALFGNGRWTGDTDDFPDRSWDIFSYPFYQEVRRRNEVFSDVTAINSLPWSVHGTVNGSGASGELEQMEAQLVSGTYFTVLGIHASLGRAFTEADDQNPGGHPVVVLSHAWWERRFGGDTAVIGKTITIGRTVYTIIGVAPKEFFGTTVGQAPDIWAPLAMEAQMPPEFLNGRNDKSFQSLHIIARLKNDVGVEQASAAVNLLFKQSLRERAGAEASPKLLQDIQRAFIELTPAGRGLSQLRRQFSLSLRLLMGMVGLVLLIACANVANLLLARAAARQREFAVRLAVGAGRVRIVRQLLTESVLLAGLGGIAGVALAWFGSRLLVLMASAGSEPLPLDVTPNTRIMGFTLLVSLSSAVIFGVAPALRAARIEPNSALKGGRSAAQATSKSPFGKALVIAQVGLSLLLLIGAGLFARTLINLQNVPTGFNQQKVMLFKIDSAASGHKKEQLAPLLREVEEKVKAAPGAQAASFSYSNFNECCWWSATYTSDQNLPERQGRVVRHDYVGPDYFTTMGIPLLLGRTFGPQDTDKSQKVAVISETMARHFFRNGSPIGGRFGINGPASREQIEVIGVVKDVRYEGLAAPMRPTAYYPHSQVCPWPPGNLLVRFSGAPEVVIPQIRQVIKQVNANLPVGEVVSLSEHIGRSLVRQRLVARLAAFFGLTALLLACIGLYGVLSYGVARRANEIGIRMALGARPRDALRLIINQGMKLALVGIGIGLAGALALTRLMKPLLFDVSETDPLTFTLIALLLAFVALLACWIPARRAMKVDPMMVLRSE